MIAVAVIACVIAGLSNVIAYVLNEHSVVWKLKCLPAPRLLFCSNRRLKRRPEHFWAFDILDPDWLTTSYFVPVWLLALLRLLIPVYVAAEIVVEQYTTPNGLGDPKYVWISFFTDWTFCVFGASGLLGFLVTLWRMLKRAKQAKVQPDAESGRGSNTASAAAAAAPQAATNGGAAAPQAAATSGAAATGNATLVLARTMRQRLCERQWTWYEAVYLLVFETSAASTLFLTVFYWAALSGDGNKRADNIMKHGTNNIMILLDVVLSRNLFVSYHWLVVLLYGTLFLIFMWAVWLPVEDYWVYSVFDWDRWRALGAYAVLPIALFIAFLIWTAVAALREAAGRRLHTRWSSAAPVAKSQPAQPQPQLQATPAQRDTQPAMYAAPQWQGAAQLQPLTQQQPQLQQQNEMLQQPAAEQMAGGPAIRSGHGQAIQGGDAAPLGVQRADLWR